MMTRCQRKIVPGVTISRICRQALRRAGQVPVVLSLGYPATHLAIEVVLSERPAMNVGGCRSL